MYQNRARNDVAIIQQLECNGSPSEQEKSRVHEVSKIRAKYSGDEATRSSPLRREEVGQHPFRRFLSP